MLTEKEQVILLELLTHEKITMPSFLKTALFSNIPDFYRRMKKLKKFGLVNGSHFWKLTYKGEVLAKILALLPNNPKNYSVNLRDEIIEFKYCPHD